MKNDCIFVPKYVLTAIQALEKKGFEAYLAGGCVRDSLLGRKPNDFDIATSATPEDVTEAFMHKKMVLTGAKHGTVSVIIDGEYIEITTYRVDGVYSDNRHPDIVTFTRSLNEDLSRRDFTINALAYHPEKGLVDYFGGVEDLKKGVIRCVGKPEERFKEDALRILRGARFACELGFEVESATLAAMVRLRKHLSRIAKERISHELGKALIGPAFADFFLKVPELLVFVIPELETCVGFEQHNKFHEYDVYTHTLRAVSNAPADLAVRLALLFHDIAKPECFTRGKSGEGHFYGHTKIGEATAVDALTALRYDRATIRRVAQLVQYHDTYIQPNAKNMKRWLNRIGEEALRQVLEVQRADNLAKKKDMADQTLADIRLAEEVLENVFEQGQCFLLKDLAVNGGDLIAEGMPEGPELGKTLEYLLEQVIDGKLDNQKNTLLRAAKRFIA